MVRVQPTAEVSDQLRSVAAVLPLPHRAAAPYSLGEAVAELGSYAQAVGSSGWTTRAARGNRDSLWHEIAAQAQTVGPRVDRLIADTLQDLRDEDPNVVRSTAEQFATKWHSKAAITDAFQDLCDAANTPGVTSGMLRRQSKIIASQIGAASVGAFSPLQRAADALVDTEEYMAPRLKKTPPPNLTESDRLEEAVSILTSAPTGRVVVWLAYYRATVYGMRQSAASMTFLRAEWALPDDYDVDHNDFPERAELRRIQPEVRWMEEMREESRNPENRLVLVRVDLGDRQLAGSLEEARRQVEGILSIAVEAGGTSWRSAGVSTVLLDGEIRNFSFGLRVQDETPRVGDNYGIGATAEVLKDVLSHLSDALAKGPMPDRLIEALASLREARMVDHRDVIFHGARRVSPRVATALEDHAMELFASVLQVRAIDLATALQRREALDRADRQIAGQLMTPFNESWALEHHDGRRQLEDEISEYSSDGTRLVSIAKAIGSQTELRALPMTRLELADLNAAIATCIDPARERALLDEIWCETGVLRNRLRRVRNAVNHGLPLHYASLESVREYADATSRVALNIALSWFKTGTPGAVLLQREQDAWNNRIERTNQGRNWVSEHESSAT